MSAPRFDADTVRRFYEQYLFLNPGGREHLTLLFFDLELPPALLQGLAAVNGTRLLLVDARRIESQAKVLAHLWDPARRYISVHDYTAHTFFPFEETAVRFSEVGRGIDYTSFEFPRFDLTNDQVELLIGRYIARNPNQELTYADAFYARLGNNPDYTITVRSGLRLDRTLHIRGPKPWLEICGPLAEGDIRFAPGSELFYNGEAIDGSLHCDGALNLLPLRGNLSEEGLCRRLLALGQRLPEDPVDLEFQRGHLVDIRSAGPLADEFKALFSLEPAFSYVVEVGIGLMESAGPLIREWAATTNEAVPGIHVGLGADPGNTSRFATAVHFDFVTPDVQIDVNNRLFYQDGIFLS